MLSITREFSHKSHGELGKITIALSESGVISLTNEMAETPEPVALTPVAATYLLNYSLRALQDAYAGATDSPEAVGMFNQRLDAILTGTVGTRVSNAATFEERTIRAVVRDILKSQKKFNKAKHDDEALDAIFAKNAEKLQPMVDQRIAAAKEQAELKANATITL